MNKIWIASFPRSGNTFFRNVLYHVYGLDSSENEFDRIIKTHELPFKVDSYSGKKDKVIYLVRDGRDSICSMAYQRKNIIARDSDRNQNMKEATIAEKASFFGGWNLNCRFWFAENPIIVRFEDLIQDPRHEFEKLEPILSLPKPDWSNLPTFEKQKKGENRFGTEGAEDEISENFSDFFFRKGKIGNWKEELPEYLQEIFWNDSQDVMEALGYSKNGDIGLIDFDKIKEIANKQWEYRLKAIQIRYWELRLYLRRLKHGK
jgi:hypothetical protein